MGDSHCIFDCVVVVEKAALASHQNLYLVRLAFFNLLRLGYLQNFAKISANQS